VQIGETYYFKVSSYDDGTAGGLADFAFVLTPTAPANDTCASPTTIPGAAYGTYAPALLDTDRATISLCEHDETCGSSSGNSNSVWYEFTPFEDGQITIDTYGSDYDTVLSIFTTSSARDHHQRQLPERSSVACSDDSAGGFQSFIGDFEVDQGETYFIKVADFNPPRAARLDFNFTFEAPAAPANDACSNATVIPAGAPGGNFQDEIRAHSATEALLCEPQESCEVGGIGTGHSVWYTLTPACNGQLNLSTQGSLYDTVMSVWTECSSFTVNGCTATSQIACDDDSGAGNTSQILSLPVMAGEDYLVKISAYGTQDADRLVLNAQFMCDATPTCDSIDFNGDGLFPDTQDIADFIAVFGGAPCPTGTCGDIDFNNDGLFPTLNISALIGAAAALAINHHPAPPSGGVGPALITFPRKPRVHAGVFPAVAAQHPGHPRPPGLCPIRGTATCVIFSVPAAVVVAGERRRWRVFSARGRFFSRFSIQGATWTSCLHAGRSCRTPGQERGRRPPDGLLGPAEQFRDRDKLMFKKQQVDLLAGGERPLASLIRASSSPSASLFRQQHRHGRFQRRQGRHGHQPPRRRHRRLRRQRHGITTSRCSGRPREDSCPPPAPAACWT
jgi:hypothetical protein